MCSIKIRESTKTEEAMGSRGKKKEQRRKRVTRTRARVKEARCLGHKI